MSEFKFGNTVYCMANCKDWNDLMSPMWDDGEVFAAVSRTFTHEEDDDLCFDYAYVANMYRGIYENGIHCELLFVVLTGYEDVIEAIQGGFSIPLEVEYFEVNEPYSYDSIIECPEAYEWLNNAANVFGVIDRFRGFYLDRYVNIIGNTGWDYINFSLGIDTPLDWADRMNDQMEE